MRLRTALLIAAVSGGSVESPGQVAQLAEDLRLDATKEDFPKISRVVVGPRGEIVVVIPDEWQLRVYDATGKKRGAIGRVGSGPGEFRSVSTLGWIADTLWAYDGTLRRISYFGPDLKVVRTVPLPIPTMKGAVAPEGVPSGVYFHPLIVYSDGVMLGDARMSRTRRRGDPTERFLAFMAPSGQVTRAAGSPKFEDPRWHMQIDFYEYDVPFTVGPQVGWSLDGTRYGVLVVDNTAKDGGVMRVSAYRRSGAPELAKVIPFKGTPVSAAERDKALAAFIPKRRTAETSMDRSKRFQAIAAERMPAFAAPAKELLLGLDKTTWIFLPTKEWRAAAAVLDEKGNLLGTVNAPPKAIIHQGSQTHVYAAVRDEDDLTSVVRYRISWRK